MALTQESFDRLLSWLDPEDREAAGRQYEIIYQGLLRTFVSHGFSDSEHLTDRTVDVVARRIPDIEGTYKEDKTKYFVGVARNIIREARRNREIATDAIPEKPVSEPRIGDELDCLLSCLKFLAPEKRNLILDYHRYDGHDKVQTRAEMANELGITDTALRGRVHQIRLKLKACTKKCLCHLRQNKK